MTGRRLKSALCLLVVCVFSVTSYLQYVYTNSVSFSDVYVTRTEVDKDAADATNLTVSSSADRDGPGLEQNGAKRADVTDDIKTILLWTSKYGRADFGIGLGRAGFLRKCAESRCSVTANTSLAATVDAILFHAWETSAENMPPRIRPDQIWIFYCLESPLTVQRKIRGTNNKYNLTITYLNDPETDIVTRIRKLKPPLNPILASEVVQRKSRTAVWPVSNCDGASSQRNEYARQLSSYVDLDVYGRCGNLSCPIEDKSNCYSQFEADYYFYLSFENSVCEQYITEKVYSALRRHMIPVVLGGGDYKRLLPPTSYIDVRDFNSPRHLADFMIYLQSNTSAYLEYFAWKAKASHYIERFERLAPSHGKTGAFCRLCQILHDRTYKYKKDFNLERYWSAERWCVSGWKEKKVIHLT
ncbi:MAG: hypothetical protein GXO35_00155 [Gammaproteobacteria bacterium]|nr:hypothetical protein [Gammaproteobacteria bacterium]